MRQLDRDIHFEVVVVSKINRTHPASTEFGLQLVSTSHSFGNGN